MSDAAFDTLKAAEAHAKAIASTMRDAVTEGVATKADLAALETRLTVRLYGVALAAGAAVVALVKLLP